MKTSLMSVVNDDEVVLRAKPKQQISKSARGSIYRGVSKNGRKWQVSIIQFYKL